MCPGCANESQVPEEPGAEDGQYSWEDESASQDSAFVIWDPQSVSLSEIFRDTWQLYIQNLWLLLGVALVDILFYLVGIVIIMIPTVLAMWMLVTMGPLHERIRYSPLNSSTPHEGKS